ncbi:hypothetical protein [Streptomyces collinus]|uniref:Uncharacterized protein n=1 Tax=Streptomyces collinus (strain DSM 40733 / Tue 365) TaxID=1214242 RepID=S5VQU5_STRC3|nr:hypothetical protein [Streptomyces collinus]AGS70740.1 hypothetical protein B446_19640 [Streptomyces collinus Tu 365]UJA09386.1 hypothetical protein HGI10_33350 [Streptomyces collinus]UJA15750.1 hypothetical protein HGI09_30770 [Streptomyces collinus]
MPGTVLLLAASPLGRGRLVDAAGVLPVLAAVAPAILSGTDTANVVELADPLEPQAVLTRLRAAAAAPGPLTVYVTGQLHLDRRQRLPHLALARTTPSTVRYTALPWHWIREELRLRPAGATALLLDLHTDAETWRHLAGRPLDSGRTTEVYGRIAPPAGRWGLAEPSYMRTVATLLRSGHRPPLAELHRQALARIADEVATNIVLTARPPAPSDPHAAISAAVSAGRHAEADALAARHEQAAVRAGGPASDDALHWAEVRADLAMFAGDAARSCRAWLDVARVRLAAGQAPDAPAVEAAADRAHHQWGAIHDAARARELGPALAELRLRVPGRRQGALENVQRHLRQLQAR